MQLQYRSGLGQDRPSLFRQITRRVVEGRTVGFRQALQKPGSNVSVQQQRNSPTSQATQIAQQSAGCVLTQEKDQHVPPNGTSQSL